VAVAPLPFDSKAYDVPSGRQGGSLRSRRDESGGVCPSSFLERAKSGLGASKHAAESAVNAGWSESDYDSSDNARDSLQKEDELSVSEPTLENERLASPPKPEEPDEWNVVIDAWASMASVLSDPRELATIDSVGPKPKPQKDATESAVNAGWGESEYDSSDNARDNQQKMDELAVSESTFEIERLASLSPKPEEPDECNVVIDAWTSMASILSGSRELAKTDGVWPKPKSQKDATESAVNVGWGESEYDSSDNARDNLQKMDKFAVPESTFENERLASLPPKPEEPDGCHVVMGPMAPTLSGPKRELAKFDMVGPNPKSQVCLVNL
jgi:hypothetical protein